MDARIGQLIREGKPVFYATAGGYFEGSLAQVETKLGLRTKPQAARSLRSYSVTVTPKLEVHVGTWCSGEYTREVMAYNRNDAIKQAREEFSENQFGNTATYRAKVAAD